MSFLVRVLNTSTKPARLVRATYPVPGGLSMLSASRPYVMRGGSAVLRLGNLNGGRRTAYRITLRADTASSGLTRSPVSVEARGVHWRTRRTAPATCGATAASTTPVRVLPVAARVQPAVTG
jgi:hypothetical protein